MITQCWSICGFLVYNNMHNYTKAIQDYNKAIELNPNDVIAYFNRGFAENNLGNYSYFR